jgi:FemAB-related protein (PEP-CTERM system-associated)
MSTATHALHVNVSSPNDCEACQPTWQQYTDRFGRPACHCDPRWLMVLREAMGHKSYLLEVKEHGGLVGVLPLALVDSFLFGRFLVSLPYVNWAGVIANTEAIATALVERAVQLADELDVNYLELRHERQHKHPALGVRYTSKANMRLPLPSSAVELWEQLRSVVRTQVRKSEKQGFFVEWGGVHLLDGFYRVFTQNMRDLGTPVYSRRLFERILAIFPDEAELCVVRDGSRPIAGSLAIHGRGFTEVPSASCLREYRSSAVNSLMYWRLIQRAIERQQQVFDFGRSTIGSGTYAFKRKWGAEPEPSLWQYYVRKGSQTDMRPECGKYDRLIAIWRRLPVSLTRVAGPWIVRGIP